MPKNEWEMGGSDNNFDFDGWEVDTVAPLWWKALLIVLLCCGALFVTWLLALVFFGVQVPATSYGVRQILIPPFRGYTQTLSLGRHLEVPWVMKVHLVPKSVQFVSFKVPLRNLQKNVAEKDQIMPLTDAEIRAAFRFFEGRDGAVVKTLKSVGYKKEGWERFIEEKLSKEFLAVTSEQDLITLSFSDYVDVLHKVQESAQKRFNRYGIDLISLFFIDAPNTSKLTKNLKDRSELELKQRELRLLQERLATESFKGRGKLESFRAAVQAEKEAILEEAERYKIQKESAGDILLAQAIAAVEQERKVILSVLPEAEGYIAKRIYETRTQKTPSASSERSEKGTEQTSHPLKEDIAEGALQCRE